MLWIYAAIIGFISSLLYSWVKTKRSLYWRQYWRLSDVTIHAARTTAVCALVGFVAMLIATIVYCNGAEVYVTDDGPHEILVLQDNQAINGEFFIGCGYLQSSSVYSWFTVDGEQTVPYDEPTSKCGLFQDSEEPYFIKYIMGDFTNKIAAHLLMTPSSVGGSVSRKFDLHVPPGTLTLDISLDAE